MKDKKTKRLTEGEWNEEYEMYRNDDEDYTTDEEIVRWRKKHAD